MNEPVPPGERSLRRRDRRRRRGVRRAAIVAMCLGVATILWFWVFPWVDRTFVNRPQIGP